ncbi:RWD domain-containing protein 4 [Asbolus verrucosus]|uniref:RWD domain-containing protein 4 n=1 Tax=Asbolus verrucosus TaxID=1661398 RepID=A0A482W4X8_ASBVE|nr:RWD domain-containing protein 4 [Asbolus verrucosus]
MSENELQEEEREVLSSIYDGDESFKQIAPNTFQYKYGESDTMKSFLVEIQWGDKYPNELPTVNMETFYNKHVTNSLKEKVVALVLTEAEQYLGMSMTYSLFEFIKEKFDELIQEQPENLDNITEFEKLTTADSDQGLSQKAPKKEHLTKAQKRRQWNRVDNKGEKPRGWNWVDIVKHLSQTGPKEPTATPTS